MTTIKTYPFQNSTILRINSEKEVINTAPIYQRQGGIWNEQKKQLLIDSILNDYDIPKLYFHLLGNNKKNSTEFDYAIIDGRQRIEAIWAFIEGDFLLSDDFEYLHDNKVKAAGLTYSDLAREYPKLKIRFDSYNLPIILVDTDDLDLIEDMFSRLNEAVPLNAAEKRNSLGGPMAKAIREVSCHQFFTEKVNFSNNRYQHREVTARLIFIEYSLKNQEKIIDTKKPYLDKMVVEYNEQDLDPSPIVNKVYIVLDKMVSVFGKKDELLRAQSTITVYYMLFSDAIKKQSVDKVSRKKFLKFNAELASNRKIAEKDITLANFDFLEFERMSQQGTNDANSIKERTRILSEYLKI
jgi:hypothetical protein